jgi:hypothetical protein
MLIQLKERNKGLVLSIWLRGALYKSKDKSNKKVILKEDLGDTVNVIAS